MNITTGNRNFLNLSGVELLGIAEIKGNSGNDTIYLEGSGSDANLSYSRNDIVRGGAGNDTIYSGLGDDQVYGDDGNDIILGGLGSDQLYGGNGADAFLYSNTFDSKVGYADKICDFSHSQGDKLDLSQIDANSLVQGDQAFTFIGSAQFAGAVGSLRIELVGTTLHVLGDINGDKIADFDVTLLNTASLVAADFVF